MRALFFSLLHILILNLPARLCRCRRVCSKQTAYAIFSPKKSRQKSISIKIRCVVKKSFCATMHYAVLGEQQQTCFFFYKSVNTSNSITTNIQQGQKNIATKRNHDQQSLRIGLTIYWQSRMIIILLSIRLFNQA